MTEPAQDEPVQDGPGIHATATATHPDRPLTAEERAHLGLPADPAEETK